MIVRYVLPVVAAALLIFAVWHVFGAGEAEGPVSPPVEPPRSPFGRTVAGAGIVEAETENIAIGSPVPGVVVEVFVEVGQEVVAGEPLFRLDDRELRAQLAVREAAREAARAELTRLQSQPRPEEVPVREAAVRRAEANLRRQQDRLYRIETLPPSVVSDEERVEAEQALAAAEADLASAQAELDLLGAGAWEQDIQVARAALYQAEAQVEQVRTELDRLVVRALIDGEILQVNVRPGEFVGAPPSQGLILLGDVRRLHVRVDIDEADIPRFVPGAPARAMLRGDPEVEFPLTFVRVEPFVVPKRSLTGDNTERVDTRVLQAIYAAEPAGLPLYVGQQVDVYIGAAPPSPQPSPPGGGRGQGEGGS